MDWLQADGYLVARELLQRGVALVYALAFANVLAQWRPLLGRRGLLPITELAGPSAKRAAPSLLWHRPADSTATGIGAVGLTLSLLLVLGLPQAWSVWATAAAFAALWVGYLSIVNAGRVFYGFGWETLLCEAGFLAIWLGADGVAPPWLALLAVRWLVIRVEVGAGLIKLRGDPCWRQLTCTQYHHETQPLPGPLSWRFHHLPRWQHRAEVAANHAVQLVAPFGLLLPQPIAGAAAAAIIVTQAWLMLSGNFAWLNLLTIVLATSGLPDGWLDAIWPLPASGGPIPAAYGTLVIAVAVLIAWRSWPPIRNLCSPHQRMNASHDPLRLVNSYGAFGSVTRTRDELIIEATDAQPVDGRVPREAAWRPYECRAKPGDPARRPPQVAPWHLRLDWLLWFAAMSPAPAEHRWFRRLLQLLLEADPQVLRLLRRAPFGDQPPTAVRVRRFRYRFTTPAERRATGDWWVADREQLVVPPVVRGG